MINWPPDALAGAIAAIATMYEEAGRMIDVDVLIDQLIDREGGFVDNPADHGGPTNFGITEQVARANGYQSAMQDLPRATAAAIYRARYWTAPGYAQVAQRSMPLAILLFDTAVNMGPKAAGEEFQRALNVLNRGASDYPDVPVDGAVGALTLHALDGYQVKRGAAGLRLLLELVAALREAHCVAIAEGDAAQEIFEFGWLTRVDALLQQVES